MKILIADDELHIVRAMHFLFTKRGHEVLVAEDGETAFELARSQQPDLVFLDVNMPKMNGFEVCEAIRRETGLTAPPIYLLTGQDRSLEVDDQMSLGGATAYLVKPIAPRELLDIVESHLTP